MYEANALPPTPQQTVEQSYTKDKYALSKGSLYLGLWQWLVHTLRFQAVSSAAAKTLMVDASASRWQVVELEQISHKHDTGVGLCRRDFGAHFIRRHLFPHLGRSFLGKGFRVWRCHEVQKTDQCFPSFKSFMRIYSSIDCNWFVLGVRSGSRCAGNWNGTKENYTSAWILQTCENVYNAEAAEMRSQIKITSYNSISVLFLSLLILLFSLWKSLASGGSIKDQKWTFK